MGLPLGEGQHDTERAEPEKPPQRLYQMWGGSPGSNSRDNIPYLGSSCNRGTHTGHHNLRLVSQGYKDLTCPRATFRFSPVLW
jgi:hypothetical protein